jgi:lysophospholipase L1-like esterase
VATLGKDSLYEASGGVAITSHTPSGTGATGGSWVRANSFATYNALASVAGGGFRQSGTSGAAGAAYLNGSGGTGPCFVKATINVANDVHYCGVMLVSSAASAGGTNYTFTRDPGAWKVSKDGGSTPLGTPTPAFSAGTPYTLELRAIPDHAAGTVTLVALVNGVIVGAYTDSTSPYTGTLYGGLQSYAAATSATALMSDFESGTLATAIAGNDSKLAYYGRWGTSSTTRQTISNGSALELAYTGTYAHLRFNVTGVSVYPVVSYWLDGVGPTRTTLTASGLVVPVPTYIAQPTGTPAYASIRQSRHTLRILANVADGYPGGNDNWGSLTHALKLHSVVLENGEALLDIPTNPNQIEFLGDSLTASLRLLYTSANLDGPAYAAPELNFPEIVGRILGLKPYLFAHGGQGITAVATDSTPVANTSFGYVYSGAAWNPAIKPAVVVIYHGTNDSSGFTQAQYQTYLSTIRAAYPSAYIFAANPHARDVGTSISAAVTALADSRVFYLNYYGTVLTSGSDYSDSGGHLNPGGAAKLAAKLATDIQAQLDTSGVKVQPAGGAVAPIGCAFIRGVA